MTLTKESLAQLSKAEIGNLLGTSFDIQTQQFVKECDKKGLISWALHVQANGAGSFSKGMKLLAEKYPTQEKVTYLPLEWTRKCINDELKRVPKKREVSVAVVPSLWVKWLGCLEYVEVA